MLIKKTILEKMKSGEITVVFRRWKKPSVKTGGALKTAVGVLAIERVEKIDQSHISEADAQQAGYSNRDVLLKELNKRDGELYKIELRYAGEDPRISLRQEDQLTKDDFEKIRQRLQRLDSASGFGNWTLEVLTAIRENPNLAAKMLAVKTGYEKEWLKQNIRKLKNLGLTISRHPGYTLSPRGIAFLKKSESND